MEIDKSDGLFRKRLENYTETPPPEVWRRIELSLNEKKSRRVLPLWITVGGVAAILLVGLMLFGPNNNTTRIIQNSISDSEDNPVKTKMTDSKVTDYPVENSELVVEENQLNISNKSGREASRVIRRENYASANATPMVSNSSAGKTKALSKAGNENINLKSDNSDEHSVNPGSKKSEAVTVQEAVAEKSLNPFGQNESFGDESEVKKNKWSLGPQVAPVYYGWVGNGSPIAASFAGNSKSGLTNLSYGLSVSYSLTSKLSLRSGINRVDLGYQTNDVAFTSSFVSRPSSLIRTINYSENSKNVVVHSTLSNSESSTAGVVSDLIVPSPEREGQMVQQFGYLEVPLELQFALVQKNWGLNLIGGMSSLFLLDNSVSLDAEGNSLEIGQAVNMNSLNFSSNFGLGAYYMVRPNVQFTVQPMFKWHLNAFSETSGQFRPYTMGVYSGLSFKF
jgi:hypothetical protein